MSGFGSETCPVCWREYSNATKPFLIVCGHTFCQECLGDLKNCPICRARIPAKYPGATNYSLLSMIERKWEPPFVQTAHVETQTEAGPEQSNVNQELVQQGPLRLPRSVGTRKGKKSIKFKMVRTQSGELDCLEVTLC